MRRYSTAGVRLGRRVRTTAPDPARAYMGDTTCLPLPEEKFLYLATVLDCFSRRVAGWPIAEHKHPDRSPRRYGWPPLPAATDGGSPPDLHRHSAHRPARRADEKTEEDSGFPLVAPPSTDPRSPQAPRPRPAAELYPRPPRLSEGDGTVADMLEIAVLTEDGRRYVRPAPEELAGLIGAIGGENNRFLVVQPIPDLPDTFIQVWHRAGNETYLLEHRAGAPDRHFQVALDGPEPVIAAMTGWAVAQDGWDTGLNWTALNLGPVEPIPPLPLDEDQREELEARVRKAILGGYATRAELARIAHDHLTLEEDLPVSLEQALQWTDRMWLERVAEQAAWEGETDPERLSRAFHALETTGITARENFACCQTCALAEIGETGAPGARGYVFFHQQCTSSAVAQNELTLLYGGFDGSPETTTAIGREVVAALTDVGLRTRWSGDPQRAIIVTPVDWRKRLVG